jgi:hypothetical protein
MDDLRLRRPPSHLGREVSPAFDVRRTVVDPGADRLFDEAEWRDAIVLVESGEIELDCVGGASSRLRCGAVLWLTGLPLRALRNRRPEPAVLLAVSRAVGVRERASRGEAAAARPSRCRRDR